MKNRWLLDMMNNKKYFYRLVCIFSVIFSTVIVAHAKVTNINFWHAMSGNLGVEINKLANRFNHSQHKFHVTPVYKGNYTQTLTTTIAAFRSHTQPALVQVFEVGTGTMMSAGKLVYYSVEQLMKDNGYAFNPNDFIPAVASYYTDTKNKLVSFPFNSSSGVMFYNKTAMKQAGLDPNTPPATWEQLVKDSKIIMKKDSMPHGFSSGWGSWLLIENTAAINGYPYATRENGYQQGIPKLLLNTAFFQKHLNNLEQWKKDHVFVYGGRYSKSLPLFSTQKIAFYMDSSSELSTINDVVNFDYGVAPLPYYKKAKGAPHNALVGGASLWVLRGHNKKAYQAVAAFLHFLSQPEIQAEWVKATGYIPTLKSASNLLDKEGYFKVNSASEVALHSLSRGTPTVNDKGIQLRAMSQIRDNIDSDLEQIWSGQMTPKKALTHMVSKNNSLLKNSY